MIRRRAIALLGAGLAVLAVAACRKNKDGAEGGSGEVPFEVRDSTEGMLFTWIDDRGDFHVEQKMLDVPVVARDAVRVVDPGRDEGTHGDRIFVADLRNARQDGTFPARVMTRAEFDAIAIERRNKRTLTLVNAGEAGAPAASASGAPDPRNPNANAGPPVIIYGAEWCGPCHQAAAYCTSRGIPFEKKDVEADANAGAEMRAKLAKAGIRGGSIPVIDVRGKILVGFSSRAIDEALGRAL